MKLIAATRLNIPDPAELKILLLKLYSEDPGVDEWIFMENSYTFSGEHKGYHFKELFESDERFLPYKDKITVLESSFNSKSFEIGDRGTRMGAVWGSENFLKNSAVDYIINKYDDDTWVSVADADEMLDFQDPRRAEAIKSALTQEPKEALFLLMVRYWYDYDNWSRGRGYPIVPVRLIRQHNSISRAYDDGRHEYGSIADPKDLLGFEYCACCGKEQILKKLQTVPFYYFTMADIEPALRCNYWPKAKGIGECVVPPSSNPDNWFETVVLDEWNSPACVREHLIELKTRNIDSNYRENRKKEFPEWFK